MVTILNLFTKEELTETNSGWKTICPCCGLQGGRTEGFILFPESNTAYCHSSKKWFTLLETYALKNKIITCLDGRETGQKEKILSPEQFKETLDLMENEFDAQLYNSFLDLVGVRERVELPGLGVYYSDFTNKIVTRIKNKNLIFYREDLENVVEVTPNGFQIVKPNRFISLVERDFKPWVKIWKKNGEVIKVDKSMNTQQASIVLVAPNFQDVIPRIKRIFSIPIPIKYNGELTFPVKGYDPRFKSWLNYNSPEIYDVDLETAKKTLYKIFNEFCFQSRQDYINAIAGLITPFLRGLFSQFNVRTPLFWYLANRERAGKDYCANITGLVYDGYATEESPVSSGEYKTSGNSDEFRKKIISNFISGKQRFHSSNNKGKVNNATLEAVATASIFSDRILGVNETKSFDNEMYFSFSGNIGLTMTPDLMNRSIFINLFLDIENANERNFLTPNLHSWVLENRGLILSSIFCLIKNWYDNDCPKGSIPFASYPEWASICGGIMEYAEIGNPCVIDKKLSQAISLDEDTDEMKTLFEYLYETKPGEWLSKTDIKELIQKDGDILTWIDWDNKSHQTKFGVKIDKFVGRILSDIRLQVEDLSSRPARRKYKFSKEMANFDKKSIFGGDFDEKSGNLGNLGNLLPLRRKPIYIKRVGNSKNVTHVTRLPKPKSDRQVQFYDAPECQNIKPTFSKEELSLWIEQNPNHTDEELYVKFGVGCFKVREELKNGS